MKNKSVQTFAGYFCFIDEKMNFFDLSRHCSSIQHTPLHVNLTHPRFEGKKGMRRGHMCVGRGTSKSEISGSQFHQHLCSRCKCASIQCLEAKVPFSFCNTIMPNCISEHNYNVCLTFMPCLLKQCFFNRWTEELFLFLLGHQTFLFTF